VEAVLQSKNVAIETIDEHIHLNEELSKHGLSTKDTRKLLNVIKNFEQEGYDTKKIVAKAMSMKSLKDSEKHLKNNCEMLANRIDRYKDILPLAERIVAMRINTASLLLWPSFTLSIITRCCRRFITMSNKSQNVFVVENQHLG
jgi:hypothetical protein